jgi:hypothetical protein
MERGVELYQADDACGFWPLVLPRGPAGMARTRAGWRSGRLIEEAPRSSARGIPPSRVRVVRAELLHGLGDKEATVAALRGVVASGRRLGLRMSELRAATLLVRLRQPGAVERWRVHESLPRGSTTRRVDARAALAGSTCPSLRPAERACNRLGPRW